MSIVKSGICDNLNHQADKMITSAEIIANTIGKKVDGIADYLTTLNWSPRHLIDQLIQELAQSYNMFCPDTSEADDITNMINHCNFLNTTIFASPSSTFQSSQSSLLSNMMTTVNQITHNLPEFNASQMFRELSDEISHTYKFTDQIDKIKKILGCLQTLCGKDISNYLLRLNAILTRCYLNNDGYLDWDKVLVAGGVTDIEKINIMNNCKESIDLANTAYYKSIKDINQILAASSWSDPNDPWPT